jgi:uncharacterized protein
MHANEPDGSAWHSGELAVQQRAGVSGLSGRGILASIPEAWAAFLAGQRLAVFASVDLDGRLWASLRVGEPGFVHALDMTTVETEPFEIKGDPLLKNLEANPDIGMLVIDFGTRRRIRINGEAEVLPDRSLRIDARQVYGNCQQYIQERVIDDGSGAETGSNPQVLIGATLNPDQQRWIERADTLFIASAHPQYGADASHCGGNPGFVKVEGLNSLVIPDYSGNRMFNTLGNIVVNPNAGLLFPDFESGRTLQLSGRATVDWDRDRSDFPGAQRLVAFRIEKVLEMGQPGLANYTFKGYSRFNP